MKSIILSFLILFTGLQIALAEKPMIVIGGYCADFYYTPDGKQIIAPKDNSIVFYNPQNGRQNKIINFPRNTAYISYMIMFPDRSKMAAKISISIIDISGRELQKIIESGDMPAGTNKFNFDLSRLASGNYYCIVSIDRKTYSIPIIKRN